MTATSEIRMPVVTVAMRGSNGVVLDVPGEPTAVKGLYVTPYMHLGPDVQSYTGSFVLTHAPSGRCHPMPLANPGDLRDLAERLAKVCDDWTGLSGDPKDWPEEIRTGAIAATRAFREELNEREYGWAQ